MLSEFLRDHGSALASAAVGLLLIVGGLYSYQSWEVKKVQEAEQAKVAAQAPPPEAEPAPPAVVSEPEPTVQTASLDRAAPIELQLQIVDTVWIRAVADGERVLEGIYRAGGQLEPIEAKNEVTLKVGNAGGVSLALNGKDLGLIGPRGHVRSLMVTPDGMEILEANPPAGAPRESVRIPSTTASIRWAQLAWSTPTVR
jgi:hypothetical protein